MGVHPPQNGGIGYDPWPFRGRSRMRLKKLTHSSMRCAELPKPPISSLSCLPHGRRSTRQHSVCIFSRAPILGACLYKRKAKWCYGAPFSFEGHCPLSRTLLQAKGGSLKWHPRSNNHKSTQLHQEGLEDQYHLRAYHPCPLS